MGLQSNRLLACVFAVMLLAMPVVVAVADEPATVSGMSYLVLVELESEISFGDDDRTLDCFVFDEDGTFTSAQGLAGTWNDFTLRALTIWNAEVSSESLNIEFSGVQFGSLIAASGQGDDLSIRRVVGVSFEQCASLIDLPAESAYRFGM